MSGEWSRLKEELERGTVIPYLGPGIWEAREVPFPTTLESLALALSDRSAVPGKLKGKLWESAHYIETYKHRKTLVTFLDAIFGPTRGIPHPLADFLLGAWSFPFIVDTWYDGVLSEALPENTVQITQTSRGEHPDRWFRCGRKADGGWTALPQEPEMDPGFLYKPFGAGIPGGDYLVSDADFVEVLTEIDIQTPIPQSVRKARTGSHFLFLGCRFDNQTLRIFARQIMKRSSELHWIITDRVPTPKEERFFRETGIRIIPVGLPEALDFHLKPAEAPAGARTGSI